VDPRTICFQQSGQKGKKNNLEKVHSWVFVWGGGQPQRQQWQQRQGCVGSTLILKVQELSFFVYGLSQHLKKILRY
jgi:hypothetical protein